jgi:hypothetical protein
VRVTIPEPEKIDDPPVPPVILALVPPAVPLAPTVNVYVMFLVRVSAVYAV